MTVEGLAGINNAMTSNRPSTESPLSTKQPDRYNTRTVSSDEMARDAVIQDELSTKLIKSTKGDSINAFNHETLHHTMPHIKESSEFLGGKTESHTSNTKTTTDLNSMSTENSDRLSAVPGNTSSVTASPRHNPAHNVFGIHGNTSTAPHNGVTKLPFTETYGITKEHGADLMQEKTTPTYDKRTGSKITVTVPGQDLDTLKHVERLSSSTSSSTSDTHISVVSTQPLESSGSSAKSISTEIKPEVYERMTSASDTYGPLTSVSPGSSNLTSARHLVNHRPTSAEGGESTTTPSNRDYPGTTDTSRSGRLIWWWTTTNPAQEKETVDVTTMSNNIGSHKTKTGHSECTADLANICELMNTKKCRLPLFKKLCCHTCQLVS